MARKKPTSKLGAVALTPIGTSPVNATSLPHLPHALTIPEILTLCLVNLPRKDLLNAALTCREWSIWSRDTVWRTVEVPFSVLLKRLDFLFEASDCYRFNGLDAEPSASIMSAEDWLHFLNHYTRKISRMYLDVGLSHVALHLLEKLAETHGGGPLSPNLRSLRISLAPMWKSTIPTIALISSLTSITNVTLKQPPGDHKLQVFSEKLATVAPHIKRLSLVGETTSDTSSNTRHTLDFSLFQQLREIHASDISLASWYTLDGDPTESVHLTGYCPDPPGESERYKKVTLPALHKLSITTTSLHPDLILHTTMPALRTLVIRPTLRPTTGGFEDMVSAISKRSSELEEVDVNLGHKTISNGTIEALASLQYLVVLRIQCLPITNQTIENLAKSIPHLRVLSLVFDPESATAERVTGAGLLVLLRHCKGLNELEISVDLCDSPHKSPAPPFQPSRTMTRLTLRQPKLPRDVRRAARFLVTCYPDVSRFEVAKGTSPKQEDHLIKEFKRIQSSRK
ncbi:hypothetical protein FRB93_006405 [Tulasnella sp. JGI-2019a]|nr:hypothetical protein FRB93_006405 [Tulasnella sp. JGI-2019a]